MAVGSSWGSCRQLQINEQSQLCFFPVDNATTDSGSDSADVRYLCIASIASFS